MVEILDTGPTLEDLAGLTGVKVAEPFAEHARRSQEA